MRLLNKLTRARAARSPQPPRRFLRLEQLESRVVPYAISGDAWPHPELITLSFVPDGTNLGGVTSNLFAKFNAKWSTSTWQNQIIKAAQLWAQQTNINFAVVSDSGADSGSGLYQQGDPTFGDIRISGLSGGVNGFLGMASMPPPDNNYSIAGDISFNTDQTFHIGTTFDLLTVAAHEMGHAVGLSHSTVSAAEMYSAYTSVKSSLNSDDIAGIRAIYSSNNARSYDSYGGTNNSFSAAANITSLTNTTTLTTLVTGLDITTTSQSEYFTINAPTGTNGTMVVEVQSKGLSLLAPKLTVYDASQTQIGYVSGSGQYGTTLTVTINGVTAGQQFYVKVAGADTTALGTGHYGMAFTFGTNPLPAVPLPNTQTLNGNPIVGGGGVAETDGKSVDRFPDDDVDVFSADAPASSATATDQSSPQLAVASYNVAIILPGGSSQPAGVEYVAGTLPAVAVVPIISAPKSVSQSPSRLMINRVESGGGNNQVATVLEEDQIDSTRASPAETVAPVPTAVDRTDRSEEARLDQGFWRQACDICFAEGPGMADAVDHGESLLSPRADDVAAALDPAAAVAMLMWLGSYWSAQPEQSDRPARRLAR